MNDYNMAERLIVALDEITCFNAISLVNRIKKSVFRFKLGPQVIFDPNFSRLLDTLLIHKLGVFFDGKMCDTPDTVFNATERACSRGIEFLSLLMEEDVINSAHRAISKHNSPTKLLLLTQLTSQTDNSIEINPEFIIKLLNFLPKADGIICPPTKISQMRTLIGPDKLIVSPGIRLSNTSNDNHRQFATPSQAISQGANYIVVGRPIINAIDPLQSANEIIESMSQ